MKKRIFRGTLCVLLCVFYLTCGKESGTQNDKGDISLEELVRLNESEIFSVAFDRYRSDTATLPIGVFDSGIGGLTVLAEIIGIDHFDNVTHKSGPDGIPDFENERFIYLGDQANMPYGNYPSENKTDFLKELILKDAIFLLGQRYWLSGKASSPRSDKPPVKAVVIACNTATAYGLEDIRRAIERWDVPVLVAGVVEAGARGAVEVLAETGVEGAVAVMATVGTCRSEGYIRAIEKSAESAGIDTPQVIQQGCLGLAGAIEGDRSYISPDGNGIPAKYRGPAVDHETASIDTTILMHYGFEMTGILGKGGNPASWRLNTVENYIRYHTTTLTEKYRSTGENEPISAVILGCTHFPYRRDSIAASFERLRTFRQSDGSEPYRGIIAGHVSFIDPSELTAVDLYETLKEYSLLLGERETPAIPADEFYISVPNTAAVETKHLEGGAFTYDYKYGRVPGRFGVEYVKRVPMSGENLSHEVMESISETMPAVWERLVRFSAESPRCGGLPESARIVDSRE